MCTDFISQSDNIIFDSDLQTNKYRTFKMVVSFDGTDYHGWQRQPNGITVQEVIEEKLGRLFGNIPIRIQGSSRTDAGVHALGMVVSFKAPVSPYIPDWKVKKALNRLLPNDIRILSAEIVEDIFNARFSAYGKSYVYVINRGETNPFTNRYSWHFTDLPNLDEMKEAIHVFEGIHDFSTFTVDRGKIDNPVREIMRTEIKCFGSLVCCYFLGTGFLYKMVRSMVGSLIFVGRGKFTTNDLRERLDAKNRLLCKDTAPGCGLFLKKVFYDDYSWKNDEVTEPPFYVL